jgi:hypothetical protein
MESGSIRRSLTDYCKIAAERLETFDRLEQQQFLRTLVDEIVFEGMQIRIRGIIPISEAKDKRESSISHSESGIVNTASYSHARNSVGIENSTAYRRDHSSGRTEGIRGCHHDPNAVEHVPFELFKPMPDTTPICELLTPEMLRRLAQANPRATLKDLAYAVQDELGVKLSITHMSRLLRRVGLNSKARGRLTDSSENPALNLAA